MALTMYMKVTGKNQGEIKGSCEQGGDKKLPVKTRAKSRVHANRAATRRIKSSFMPCVPQLTEYKKLR